MTSNLTRVFDELVEADLTTDQQLDLLRQMSVDAATPDLLAHAVRVCRQHMITIPGAPADAVDLCGTGGDNSNTFNISTTAAFLASRAGVPVAKHGNKAVSSKSGSIDCLLQLGAHIPETLAEAQQELTDKGLVFLFAPYFHPLFKKFGDARKQLASEGVLTIFNLLGPLLNPMQIRRSLLGVFRADLVPMIAETLVMLEWEKALVVHGTYSGHGLDELSLTGPNQVARVENGAMTLEIWQPEDIGMTPCHLEDLAGGTPSENAAVTQGILAGEITGPKRDIAVLNAAAAVSVSSNTYKIRDAIAHVEEAIP